MTINQAFKHLIDHWKDQDKEFKDKYRSYKSKYLSGNDYVGEGKMIEMLKEAGYKVEIIVKITLPKK